MAQVREGDVRLTSIVEGASCTTVQVEEIHQKNFRNTTIGVWLEVLRSMWDGA